MIDHSKIPEIKATLEFLLDRVEVLKRKRDAGDLTDAERGELVELTARTNSILRDVEKYLSE